MLTRYEYVAFAACLDSSKLNVLLYLCLSAAKSRWRKASTAWWLKPSYFRSAHTSEFTGHEDAHVVAESLVELLQVLRESLVVVQSQLFLVSICGYVSIQGCTNVVLPAQSLAVLLAVVQILQSLQVHRHPRRVQSIPVHPYRDPQAC